MVIRIRGGWLALLLLTVILGAGCTGSRSEDKAGSSRDPVVLHAYRHGCLDWASPGAADFWQRVAELSGCALRIEVSSSTRSG